MINPIKSLNGKIILAIILSLAIVLGTSSYLLSKYQRGQMMKQMQDYSSHLNDVINYSLEHDMLKHEVEDIYKAIKNLEKQGEIARIFVLNPEGKIAFSSKPEEKGKMLKEASISFSCRQTCHESMPDSPRRIAFLEDVEKQRVLRSIRYIPNQPECQTCHSKDKKILGALLIDTSLARVENAIAGNSKIMFLSGLLALLSAAFVIIVSLRKLVIKPIEELAFGTQKLADGDLSYRIKTKMKDEIGRLINSFNTMAGKLKNSQEKLESFNEELQREVERKTHQIRENTDRLFKATQTFNELTLSALRDEHEAVFENPHLKRCWQRKNCENTDCPAYQSDNLRCWQIAGTFCNSEPAGDFATRLGDCRKCQVFQSGVNGDPIVQIGENFNNMMHYLKSKHQKLIDFSEQLQEKHKELLQRNSELSMLLDIGAEFSYSIEFQHVIDKILTKTTEFFGSHSTALFLLDEDKTKFTVFAVTGWEGEEEIGRKMPANYGVPGWVIANGQPVLIHDTQKDFRFKQIFQKQFVRSILEVPLKVKGEVIGALGTASLSANFYNEEQIHLLTAIANYAAVAIENAKLFEEQKRSYKQLKETHEQMVRTEKLAALGEMVSGAAHNFNNVLAGILGYTQLLQMQTTNPQILNDLNIIEQATLSGAATVKRMQNFAKKAASNEELIPLSVNEVVKSAVKFTETAWRNTSQEKGININMRTELGKVELILGNATELLEVLSNMILNAVDAMPQGGEIVIRTFTDAESVIITVKDTGVGMSKEIQRKIFDPFFTTKGVQGTGLGLSVSHSIIQRHGGAISVNSQEGQGTTFIITLPTSLGERKVVEEKEIKDIEPVEKQARILVAEDEYAIRNFMTTMLTNDGHDVTIVSDGDEAIELLKKSNYDIVITDLGMPGASGWEVAQAAKDVFPDTFVIMISGYGLEMSKNELRKRCVDVSFDKPIRVQKIRNIINEALSSAIV